MTSEKNSLLARAADVLESGRAARVQSRRLVDSALLQRLTHDLALKLLQIERLMNKTNGSAPDDVAKQSERPQL